MLMLQSNISRVASRRVEHWVKLGNKSKKSKPFYVSIWPKFLKLSPKIAVCYWKLCIIYYLKRTSLNVDFTHLTLSSFPWLLHSTCHLTAPAFHFPSPQAAPESMQRFLASFVGFWYLNFYSAASTFVMLLCKLLLSAFIVWLLSAAPDACHAH